MVLPAGCIQIAEQHGYNVRSLQTQDIRYKSMSKDNNIKKLEELIRNRCMARDQFRLQKKFKELFRKKFSDLEALTELQLEAESSYEEYLEREQSIPELCYPEELPIVQKKDEIRDAIINNRVVVIAGATGSGKTTQLPKICLEAGCGRRGFIGHTQPRRLAARTVAQRLSEELGTQPGTLVGYKVRFTDHTDSRSLVKIMTDGILLAELTRDHFLDQYDTIIIDEAHERSLNIDFLLGYLKQLLERRRDLKVIITSATIDVQSFSTYFNNAPVIEVSGRTYPVETRYRSPADNELNPESDPFEEGYQAIEELGEIDSGDILVFLDGERSIYDFADFLRKKQLKHTEILPLYARLSNAEQNRIFQPHAGRHIILATNVAETSLTVPGIKYVIDFGDARISRYSVRTKVQRLPIEPVSKASADQRRGRCGRTCPGVCIRLYSQQDYEHRQDYTDPEILRTNLASVILQMINLRLGDIESFPFPNPPDHRQIGDGFRLLEEIGALDEEHRLTPDGKLIARLPIDPRLAKMVVTASRTGALSEVLIIVSALSIQDPRERPLNKKNEANQMHERFNDPDSDFNALLNLWKYIRDILDGGSYNELRRRCRKEFLSYLRIREWEDLHRQLEKACRELGLRFNENEADFNAVHRALSSALLSHIGSKSLEGGEYIGARGAKFIIAYTSGLHKKNHKWIMASDLAETNRLYARNVSRVDPRWLEEYGAHLLKRSYSEIRWSKNSGAVVADLRLSLYGLPIVEGRTVQYSHEDPQLCRELFIRHALVEADFDCREKFFIENQKLISEILDEEDKARRKDILVSDDDLFEFYNRKLPAEVNSAVTFKKWWQKQMQSDPKFLNFDREFLISDSSKLASASDFPDHITIGRYRLALSYVFDPTRDDDGVTVKIPLSILNQFDLKDFDFIVPGLRNEFFIAVIKSLPKNLRKLFIPAPVFARSLQESIDGDTRNLWHDIESNLTRIGGTRIEREDFDLESIPAHLKYNFDIVSDNGKTIKSGRDLTELKNSLQNQVQKRLEKIAANSEQSSAVSTTWNFGTIPEKCVEKRRDLQIVYYQALREEEGGVRLVNVEDPVMQNILHRAGLRRLLLLNCQSPVGYLREKLPNRTKLTMYYHGFGRIDELIGDFVNCAIDYCLKRRGSLIWNEADFNSMLKTVKGDLNELVEQIAVSVENCLVEYTAIGKMLKGKIDLRSSLCFASARDELQKYVFKGFVTHYGYERLKDLHRYLLALHKRVEKIISDPARDQLQMRVIANVEEEWRKLFGYFKSPLYISDEVKNIGVMIEELKISLFAQSVGTRFPISEKRILNEIQRVKSTL